MIYNLFFWFAAVVVVIALCFLLRGLRVIQSRLFVRGFVPVAILSALLMLVPASRVMDFTQYVALTVVIIAGVILLYDLALEFGIGAKRVISLRNPFSRSLPEYIKEICRSMQVLTSGKVGALVIVENRDNVDGYINSGVSFDATIRAEILTALFMPDSPVHDGAVIVKAGRIVKAGAILPLSSNEDIDISMGTRHRSAIGITEETDAIAFVASEQRGEFSIGYRGSLSKVGSPKEMVKLIRAALLGKKARKEVL
ncbi:diadenylate cyclase [Thermoproteota archaeon]